MIKRKFKIAIEFVAEVLLFILYLMYRISQTFTIYKQVDSYKRWKSISQNVKSWTWFVFFWTVSGLLFFFGFWWTMLITAGIFAISVILSAYNGLKDIYRGLKERKKKEDEESN
jgi:hypothetical protein